jgi:hypothetical protein
MKSPTDELFHLDLGKLNWIGWLLLLATVGFLVLALFLTAPLIRAQPGQPTPRSGWNKLLAVLVFGAAAAFFVGARWALAQAGISIYRKPRPKQGPIRARHNVQ